MDPSLPYNHNPCNKEVTDIAKRLDEVDREDQHEDEDRLVTPTSLALSLSPPRSPPHGTAHRSILVGDHKLTDTDVNTSSSRHDFFLRKSAGMILHRMRHPNFRMLSGIRNVPHPHLERYPEAADRWTRRLGAALPLRWQNALRDSGGFRAICDTLVTASAPMLALSDPFAAVDFVEMGRASYRTRLRYGSHAMQVIDLYERRSASKVEKKHGTGLVFFVDYGECPFLVLFGITLLCNEGHFAVCAFFSQGRVPNSPRQIIAVAVLFSVLLSLEDVWLDGEIEPNATSFNYLPIQARLATFVLRCRNFLTTAVNIAIVSLPKHGGAWGSGKPWMYRLIARPFLDLGMVVAVVGYRTYPDAHLDGQVADLQSAAVALSRSRPDLVQEPPGRILTDKMSLPWLGVCLMGHSSGAHIALLMLVEIMRKQMELTLDESLNRKRLDHKASPNDTDHRATMRVDNFIGLSGPYAISHHFDYEAGRGVEELSPLKPVCGYGREEFEYNSPAIRLARLLSFFTETESVCMDLFAPRVLLIHGVEDSTVPFTATAIAANELRSCGLTRCKEVYIGKTGHQDTVMQIMLGGKSRDTVIDWLLKRGQRRMSLYSDAVLRDDQGIILRSNL